MTSIHPFAMSIIFFKYHFLREYNINEDTVTMKSPYGGLLVITGGAGYIKFSMSNVVEAPRYDISDLNISNQWQVR